MSDTKHTPKYSVAFGGDYNGFRYAVVSDGDPSHIATIEIEAEIDPNKPCVARATANLFAAAPALLEALVMLRDNAAQIIGENHPSLKEVNELIATARA